jgi:hypothetical protein
MRYSWKSFLYMALLASWGNSRRIWLELSIKLSFREWLENHGSVELEQWLRPDSLYVHVDLTFSANAIQLYFET